MPIFYIKGNVPIVADTVRVEGELRVFYDRKGQVVAKISISVLKAIENNQFEDLPSGFYLRNFLKSYSKILQIDSQKIIDGYLKNISHVQKND